MSFLHHIQMAAISNLSRGTDYCTWSVSSFCFTSPTRKIPERTSN